MLTNTHNPGLPTYDLMGLTHDQLLFLNSLLLHSRPPSKKWLEIRDSLFYGTPDTDHLDAEDLRP